MFARSLAAALLAASLLAVPAAASVLFEQLPQNDGFISDTKVTPQGWSQVEADDFVLDGTGRVDRVVFWTTGAAGDHAAFRIMFLADDGSGLPGETVASFGFSSVQQEEDGDFVRCTAPFAPGVGPELQAGTRYWLSVAGDDPYTGDPDWAEVFRWAAQDGADAYARTSDGGLAWDAMMAPQPAFRLEGDVVPVTGESWGRVKALYRR